jgi:hypothetical protein
MSQSMVEMTDYDDGNVLDTVCIQIVVQASSKRDGVVKGRRKEKRIRCMQYHYVSENSNYLAAF